MFCCSSKTCGLMSCRNMEIPRLELIQVRNIEKYSTKGEVTRPSVVNSCYIETSLLKKIHRPSKERMNKQHPTYSSHSTHTNEQASTRTPSHPNSWPLEAPNDIQCVSAFQPATPKFRLPAFSSLVTRTTAPHGGCVHRDH